MEIVSVSVLSKVLSLDKLSCPQIWNIEQEKVGGRPAKLKGDRDLEREIKNRRRHFFWLEEQHESFVAAVTKWEMLAATNARWKWTAVTKRERECYNIVIFTPCVEFHLHVLLDSLYIQFRLYLRAHLIEIKCLFSNRLNVWFAVLLQGTRTTFPP